MKNNLFLPVFIMLAILAIAVSISTVTLTGNAITLSKNSAINNFLLANPQLAKMAEKYQAPQEPEAAGPSCQALSFVDNAQIQEYEYKPGVNENSYTGEEICNNALGKNMHHTMTFRTVAQRRYTMNKIIEYIKYESILSKDIQTKWNYNYDFVKKQDTGNKDGQAIIYQDVYYNDNALLCCK